MTFSMDAASLFYFDGSMQKKSTESNNNRHALVMKSRKYTLGYKDLFGALKVIITHFYFFFRIVYDDL